MTALSASHGSLWKRFTPLFGAGLLGVAAIVPMTYRTLAGTGLVPAASLPLVTAASIVQTSLLLAGAVALGTALAPRLRLRSHLQATYVDGQPLMPALRAELPLAAGLGALAGAAVVAADLAMRPFMVDAWRALSAAVPHNTLYVNVLALLYGGITEELFMRWGLMSLFAWTGWRLVQSGRATPGRGVMWAAIGLAALLFGLAHLPATATVVAITPLIAARAVLLNGIAGLVFGWLFWRRSLESAMIAHMAFHVLLTAVTLSGLLPG